MRLVTPFSACLLALAGCGKKASPPAPPPPAVTVAHPLQQQVVDWDEFVGHFEAVSSVDVRPRVTGYLTRIAFRDGQVVHAGDLLFAVDPRPYQALLDQAKANAASAAATLSNAQVELKREQSLSGAGAGSAQDLETRRTALSTAQAGVGAAQAAVRQAALNLSFTRVTAPITGRASDRKFAAGNLVTQDQTVLTTLVSLDPIRFLFTGSEEAYLKYQRENAAGTRPSSRRAPNPVLIQIEGENAYRIRGRMDFVDNTVDPQSGVIRGRAVVPNPGYLLTPGLFGHMRLLGSGAYQALLVPEQAVATDQARQIVYVVGPDGKLATRVVELGQAIGNLRVIRSGIKAEDSIVIDGLTSAKAGAKVRATQGHIDPPPPGTIPQPGQ